MKKKLNIFSRAILGITILVIIFEVIYKFSPLIIGNYVHKQFTVSQTKCRIFCDSQGKKVIWKINERGARGSLYHGQKLSIATFGSSTTASTPITQHLSWPEQLKKRLNNEVHIDNYAKDGSGNKEIEIILNEIIEKKIKYDAILIMDHFGHEKRAATKENTFSYLKELSSEKPLASLRYIKRKIYNFLISLKKKIMPSNATKRSNFSHPYSLDINNRKLRNSGQVKLVDKLIPKLSEEKNNYIKKRVKKLSMLAKSITKNVYFLIQPIAYDEQELPGVSKRWYSLYPLAEDDPIYKSNKTVAWHLRLVNAKVIESAIRNNTKVIDLDRIMRKLLSSNDDLFQDKWHFSPKGSQIAADIIRENIVL